MTPAQAVAHSDPARPAPSRAPHARRSFLRTLSYTARGLFGALPLLLLTLGGIAAPLLAPYDPLAINIGNALAGPSWQHLLGTDQLGRDLLSRLLFAARGSLGAAAATVLISTTIGTLVGMVAGFYGGWLDRLLVCAIDIMLALPSFILALVLAGALGPGLWNVVLAMILARWAGPARVVRGLTLSLRQSEFVEAARAVGARNGRIMVRHLLPNILGPIVVLATLNLGSAILGLSGLSFLGLGVQLPHPEWGAMLNQARPYIQTEPRLMIIPGLVIVQSVLSANLLGDLLRDVLDPQAQRAGGARGG
jgi:peptide/nickel transport system permease protein